MIDYDSPDVFKQVCEEAEKLMNKKLDEINTDFLVDLLLEMSNDFKDSIISWFGTNISHRYKIQNISKEKEYLIPDWKVTVNRTCSEIIRKIKRNPSLKKWVLKNWDEVWETALDDYADAQIKYKDLPDITDKQCPWGLDELLVRMK